MLETKRIELTKRAFSDMLYVDSYEDWVANRWECYDREIQTLIEIPKLYSDVVARLNDINKQLLAQSLRNEAFNAGNCIKVRVR